MTENKDNYRKIIIRFLKECGLYDQFKNYIKRTTYVSMDKNMPNYWCKKRTIDSVLGALNFSDHLFRREFKLKACISHIFRVYMIKRYGNTYKLNNSMFSRCSWFDEENAIDKYTGTIDINKLME